MNGADTRPICACGTVPFPSAIYNAPGLGAIAYRPGDYAGFRHALLQALPHEANLTSDPGQVVQVWRPGVDGDLALQMAEWWAYLSEVLAFYSERRANEIYLRTAQLPESVNRLVQLLGYKPRPALGGRTTLAVLRNSTKALTIPKGFQIQSKPGPGHQPQVFEADTETRIEAPDLLSALAVTTTKPVASGGVPQPGQSGVLWLAGKVGSIKAGEKLLLIDSRAMQGQATTDFAWLSISGSTETTDPGGKPVTQVSYSTLAGSPAATRPASAFALLRAAQSMPLWGYQPSPAVVSGSTIELASIARGVGPADLMLLEGGGPLAQSTAPVIVQSYAEVVWYANGNGPSPPVESPPGSIPPVSIPHSEITFAAMPSGDWANNATRITLRWGWASVGTITPVVAATDLAFSGDDTGTSLGVAGSPAVGPSAALIEDADGDGACATASVAADGTVTLTNLSSLPPGGLTPPIDLFFNLVAVSRGKTVVNEILGSGNATVPGQDFALRQSPVTYLQDPASISGDNYSSTVCVAVNGVQWTEVRSFYNQDKNAQIFLLREDERGVTHVVFGDGLNGARLPTGVNNVVASYRYGAGADTPPPETLTVVLNPQPGLKAIRNPMAPIGAADADPPDRTRSLAPRSVLTFGRAVSLDDYQVIVATAPGVVQTAADFVYDALAQRPRVTIWVAGDAGAVSAARTALAGAADPNRPVTIIAATPVEASITLTYVRDPKRAAAAIEEGLVAALLDPDTGLFGVNVVRIGQVFYDSQIYLACRKVPGVLAVHDLSFTIAHQHHLVLRRFRCQPFGFLFPQIAPVCADHRHDPGAGKYFLVENDGAHLSLTGMVART